MATWLAENAADLIGHALTIIGISAATITVIWQLGRQHRSSLLLQRDNAREALKVQLHEILVQKVRKLSSACVNAGMYAFMIPFHVENYQTQVARGMRPSPIKDRASEFSRLHFAVNSALVELIEEFEAWSIAFPGLEVFQMALNSANHDAQREFDPLSTALLTVLPFDPPPEALPHTPTQTVQSTLSSDEQAHLKEVVQRYKDAMDVIGCYVHDLAIESQNNLLSGLFERRIPSRKPIDPSYKVISTEPAVAKQLLHHFENESSWGRANKVAEAEVKAGLRKP
jgi:hypothetical protein